MMTAGIAVRGYTIEDNRILFVCDERGFKDMNKAKNFLLRQPEVMEFEWNNKKSLPGDIPTSDDEGEAPKDPLAKFQEMQEEQQRKFKHEQRQKKKAEQEKAKKNKKQPTKKAERETTEEPKTEL